MTPEGTIELLRGIQNKKVDYAEMVCAPAFAYGYEYVYPEPEDYAIEEAIKALNEIQQYREIGTVEELKNSTREEDILKFYYCESEDDYYLGQRVENKYYARYGKTGFTWFMSRYLPWGEHVIAPNTIWKEYTYPSEPKEIPFFEWLQGFMKKYCGGTVEECRKAVEKQKPKKPIDADEDYGFFICPVCRKTIYASDDFESHKFCLNCGQAIQWDENLEGMKDEKN